MKPRFIQGSSDFVSFAPRGGTGRDPIQLELDEMEAVRLVDYLGLSQEEAATSMGVSRGTVWRCVDSGRRKLVAMVVEGRPLTVGRDSEDATGKDD
ncbi:MAG: DUF134 domain-containing protein [Methanomassiliicoccales archaeon]|nr:DUF134 domain-containing protein [Methanomassiliicoccales archaeon]